MIYYYCKKINRRFIIQFKKAFLRLYVLGYLYRQDSYGYDLVNEVSRNSLVPEGNIYPLLRQLRNEGFVSTYLKESPEGPPRRYYRITDSGRNEKENLQKQWFSFTKKFNKLLLNGEKNE